MIDSLGYYGQMSELENMIATPLTAVCAVLIDILVCTIHKKALCVDIILVQSWKKAVTLAPYTRVECSDGESHTDACFRSMSKFVAKIKKSN